LVSRLDTPASHNAKKVRQREKGKLRPSRKKKKGLVYGDNHFLHLMELLE
jgi:hypothetical protein